MELKYCCQRMMIRIIIALKIIIAQRFDKTSMSYYVSHFIYSGLYEIKIILNKNPEMIDYASKLESAR